MADKGEVLVKKVVTSHKSRLGTEGLKKAVTSHKSRLGTEGFLKD